MTPTKKTGMTVIQKYFGASMPFTPKTAATKLKGTNRNAR